MPEEKTVQEQIDVLAIITGQGFERVDNEFKRVHSRIDLLETKTDKRFDDLDKRFDVVDKRFDRLEKIMVESVAEMKERFPRQNEWQIAPGDAE